MAPEFIDIHTHNKAAINWSSIYNAALHQPIPENGYCSLGLHPWNITSENLDEQLLLFKEKAAHKNVVCIGECGLDRAKNENWDDQLKAFIHQIQWANHLNKPMIIHAVRAQLDIITLLRKQHNTQEVIFHGVNHKNIDAIWQAGYYVSFGAALLNSKSQAAQAFARVPADTYFLESDDAAISIEEIYKAAALIKHTTLENILQQTKQNFQSIFAL